MPLRSSFGVPPGTFSPTTAARSADLRARRAERDDLVAGGEHRLGLRDHDVPVAEDRDDRRVGGQAQLVQRAADGRRPRREASSRRSRCGRPPGGSAGRGRRRSRPPRPSPSGCGAGRPAASTPHCSVNSHSFLGWLTRASTRGTANSCFASSDVTRLSSSSPVAATTTSACFSSASSSTHGSQASPSTTATLGAHSSTFCDDVGVLIDQRDLVTPVGEVGGEVATDRARSRDDDLHQWCSPVGAAMISSSRSIPSFAMMTAEVVALLERAVGGRDEAAAAAGDADDQDLPVDVHVEHRSCRPDACGTGTRSRTRSPPPKLSRTSWRSWNSISWICLMPHVVVATVGMLRRS